MTMIRQPSLFGIQESYDMGPTQRYEAIIQRLIWIVFIMRLIQNPVLERLLN